MTKNGHFWPKKLPAFWGFLKIGSSREESLLEEPKLVT